MCGIAGYLNLDGRPASAVTVDRMGEAIAHRGPDGHGSFVDGPMALAHRRLAIIDLTSAAAQPMASADGRYVLIFNGEIYNYRELRPVLTAAGCVFRSQSDTEVLLNALITWGEEALPRLNGMFAFAFWDSWERRLLLARDRYGIKPLYISQRGNSLIFGSEVKALLEHPDCSAEVDPDALVEYFTFQNFLTDRTLFSGVHVVPPGTHVTAGIGRPPTSRRWWDFDFREPEVLVDPREEMEELSRLFQQAVQRQLVSDVPLGAYLSGGMDSGSVAAVASRETQGLTTFTVGFDLSSISGLELSYDERGAAEHLSYLFSTEQYEMVLKSGDLERVMPRYARYIEEPRVGQSYPNFYAAQLASKFVKVCLSGVGGDELFGGYPWRYYRAVANDSFDSYVAKYYEFWQRLVPDTDISEFLAPIWSEVTHTDPREVFRSVFGGNSALPETPEEYVNASLYFETKTFLHGLLLVEDKVSMAHGLETRVPFLDNDLVDFAMKVSVRRKLSNLSEAAALDENEPGRKTSRYFGRTNDGKVILRKMMENDFLPREVVEREKQGFSAPDATWFKGESLDYVRRTVLGPNAHVFDYVDRDRAMSFVEEHLSGNKNRRLFIWSMLSFELWLQSFVR